MIKKAQFIQTHTPKLDQVALYTPIPSPELDVRVYQGNYAFLNKNIVQQAGQMPVYRYAKSYMERKKKFSLLLLTRDNDAGRVEKFLDNTAVNVTETLPTLTGVKYVGVQYAAT